ncbi:MAG: hypothetical protein VYC86_06245 [Pseudomonadota bacterium]|nr:hypothetical protein [Pseudomonadota bacterium]MEE3183188.1 hypothetical protein [Pseudomonadota bacterium]
MEGKVKIQLAYGLYLGVATAVFGLYLAYTQRSAGDALVASHCRFLIRTFWFGVLYVGLSGLLVGLLPGGIYLLAFPALWWFIRCVKGLMDIVSHEPVQNEETWLF